MTLARGKYESAPQDGVDGQQRDLLVDIKGRLQVVIAAGAALLGKLTITGAAKGATTAADVTATSAGSDHNNLDVIARDTSGTVIDFATATKQSDGSQKAICRGGAKGATTAADVTSTAQGTDHQGLDVQLRDSSGNALNVLPVVVANPTSVARGSQTATSSAVALGGSTAYTGGIDIWNSSATDSVTIGTGTPTDGAGSNRVVLGPGQGYHEPTGDLSALKIIAASGSAVVNWIASTR